MGTPLTLAEKQARSTTLLHQWGQAERLCNAICHALDWPHDGEHVRRLEALLARARARAQRRYGRMNDWILREEYYG